MKWFRRTPNPRDGWQHYSQADGIATCCSHCAADCFWRAGHIGACPKCIKEMEASRPLSDCVTGADHRCITCESLHGVRITHGRTW